MQIGDNRISLLDPGVEKTAQVSRHAFHGGRAGYHAGRGAVVHVPVLSREKAAAHLFDALVAGDNDKVRRVVEALRNLQAERFYGRLGARWILRAGEELQDHGSESATEERLDRSGCGDQPVLADAGGVGWREEPENARGAIVDFAVGQIDQLPAIDIPASRNRNQSFPEIKQKRALAAGG